MADFSAVLKKTIDALKENTPEAREKIYQKARATIEAKLAAINPPPPAAAAERQRKLLEDAIAAVEADYAEPEAEVAQEDELEHIFAELDVDPVTPPQPAASPEPVQPASFAGSDPAETGDEENGDRQDEPAFATNETSFGHLPHEDAPEAADDEADPGADAAPPPRTIRRRSTKAPRRTAPIIVVALVALAAAGVWFFWDELVRVANFEKPPQTATETGNGQPAETPAGGTPPDAGESGAAQTATEPEPQRKFTQRLLPDGQEVDEGPADGEPGLGEGTSVAQATVPGSNQAPASDTPAAGNGAAPVAGGSTEQALPVGQKAIYYEERTNVSQGSADPGSVVWSVVQESPGNDLPPEPAIRAEATVPEKNLQMKMTIRRNADQSLPASHIVEIIFLTPDDFDGGGIDNVLRVSMKRSEQDTGNPLLGIPAKIADGFFLVALSDSRADTETNTLLLRRQSWIDIPVVYKSGRRALITIEKGIPGDKIFSDVLSAWQNASSG
ncbi:hypothetical protein [Nitratireductor sp. ZSWI3]|uniref:hypothetical protein n=1 Tax=Nitratireductor sp. ZSWI3 TaxID=2966359 RepID=UPI00215023DC|nr:hypothetical protein [Nitratireductor sp. ZSWI3]MCR4267103.1 hypothetical protein [Nitratireductor sp. ZSWI3]